MLLALGFLLFATLVGLAFAAFHALQLHTTVIRLESDLTAQRELHEQNAKTAAQYCENARKQYQTLADKYNEDAKRWKSTGTKLFEENKRLNKWKAMADAELKAAQMVRAAQTMVTKAKTDADAIVAAAQRQSTELLTDAERKSRDELAAAHDSATSIADEAREKAKSLKEEAQAILNSATTQAARMIADAQKKAQEIAGGAYEILQNASLYEKTAKAIKNIIDGYGNEYIVPQQNLLDDLAEGFDHKQAGQELKRARETTRTMIQNGTAATCDYVEANRRETASNFVVDAFNGKVDSILSRVKHDNVGKLEQQIRDAFALVNYNGKAFRDARITEAFLDARLDELRWAATAQQLALEEREEQRRSKEQIREEARAEKERARAVREAAKEEEALLKGMELGRQQAEQASGEQKLLYEQRLQEMAERLKEIEERKQRARSMAEQTKKGYVYIISNIGSFGENVYKIGLTRRWDPLERVRELGDSSVPFSFDVHATILHDDAPALEQKLHRHFLLKQVNKVNHRKEFFRASVHEIREEIEKLGITSGVHWTMAAEAKEYYESQKIEKVIADNPTEREAWMNRQYKLELMTSHLSESDDEEMVEELSAA